MAETAAGTALSSAHRAAQLATQAGSLRNLVLLWRAVDATDLSGTIDSFVQAAVLLAGQGFESSAGLAARYYPLFRTVEGITGAAPAIRLAQRLPTDYVAGQLRGAALSGIINARRAGQSVDLAQRNGLVKVMGTMGKLVLTGGRMTVTDAVQRDRKALGFARVTSGSPCPFCRALAARGPVYKTERSASFETHDHCNCSVEPSYDRSMTPDAERFAAQYAAAQRWARENDTGSTGTGNNQLNNFRRYLAGGATAGASPVTEASG